jgi:hypothetical protein
MCLVLTSALSATTVSAHLPHAVQVRYEIKNAKKNPVLDTTGANAVSICLDVDTSDS